MTGVTGTLGLFSLVDLFQLLSSASRTGRLGVEHPRGLARVYFDRGQVVHAQFGDLEGSEAVYALFADEQGEFEFTNGLPAPERTVEVGTENLMLEAIRRLDESRKDAVGEPISRSAVPALTGEDHVRYTLQPLELEVLRRIDARRNVTQIALEADIEPEEAMRVVTRLQKIGALKILARPPRTARLVARLAREAIPTGSAGLDPGILRTWERSMGSPPTRVVARRADGRVLAFGAVPLEGAGPYIHLSRDTLLRADLAANATLLVRPARVASDPEPAADAATGPASDAAGERNGGA